MPREREVTPDIVSDQTLVVGESPCWDAKHSLLYCVDIIGRRVLCLDPSTGDHHSWAFDDFPTAFSLTNIAGEALVTCAKAVVRLNLQNGQVRPYATPEPNMPGNRLNEAKADPSGRLWVGSMQTNLNPDGSMRAMDRTSGAVYRLDVHGSSEQMTEASFGITNTMAWDTDRGRFYVGDSLADVIFAYDYDDANGTLKNKRVFAEAAGPGAPDGSCLDAEGYLWSCRYAGGCLLRIAPDGQVDQLVKLPATNITDCTFGGPNLETMFVTTASNGLSAQALAANPYEGAVLSFTPGVAGVAEHKAVIGSCP